MRGNAGEFTSFKYKEMECEKTYYTITYITNFIMKGRKEISATNLYQEQHFLTFLYFLWSFVISENYGKYIKTLGNHILIFKGNPFTWPFPKLHKKEGSRVVGKKNTRMAVFPMLE